MKRAIDQLFQLRNKFAIIGLTGKTGSGCTAAATILCTQTSIIDSANQLRHDQTSPNNQKREWEIIYNYCKKNWHPFHHIRVKDIISTFILEDKFEEASKYFLSEFNINIEDFKKKFDTFYEKNKIIDPILKWNNIHYTPATDQGDRGEIENRRGCVKEYITTTIQQFTNDFKNFLDSKDNSYIKAYQTIADNIRQTGCAFRNKDIHFEFAFSIARRINSLIKVIRKDDTGPSFFVIDAFRNPLEIHFFRERYSAFYLMAINCSENERRTRLASMNLKRSQIDELDRKEKGEKKFYENYSAYIGQNIKECVQMSDLHINNTNENSEIRPKLAQTIIRYVALIQHPGIVKPTRKEFLMQLAVTASTNSGCISRNVGAVITDKDFEPLAIGWNCVPQPHVPCNLRGTSNALNNSDPSAYSDYEKTNTTFINTLSSINEKLQNVREHGIHDSYCFKDIFNNIEKKGNQVHTRALHAEENTILQCAKHGINNVTNGYLFTSASPCVLCAKKICQLGIKEVFYMDPYPDITEEHVFGYDNGRVKMTLYTGATGLAFQKLYTPLIPLKDEIEAIQHNLNSTKATIADFWMRRVDTIFLSPMVEKTKITMQSKKQYKKMLSTCRR